MGEDNARNALERMMQLDLDLSARAAGERLADLCASKAESQGWDREGAEKFVIGWLVRHGPMSSEALTDAAKAHGFRPHSDKAFGSVYSTLSRKHKIRSTGLTKRQKGHGSIGAHIFAAVL